MNKNVLAIVVALLAAFAALAIVLFVREPQPVAAGPAEYFDQGAAALDRINALETAVAQERNARLLLEEALQAIARRAMARKTGARGLRTIMESTLLNSMYELPSLENVSKIVVDESVIDGESEPFIVYENLPSNAVSGE